MKEKEKEQAQTQTFTQQTFNEYLLMPYTILGKGDTLLSQKQKSSQIYILELGHKHINVTGE